MNYIEAMDYIRDSLKFGSILGLERIEKLLERMGNPQDRLKYIHVGGTNGKGSTVTFISSMLIEAGYRVGIYTSPSIHNFNERIRINDRDIADEDIASLITMIKGKVEEMVSDGEENPTEFEITTAMAFQYFHDQACDFVLLEVGLGGRLDSTNIIRETEVSVITTIDYDHMEILGDTLTKIAAEKAGIIKENGDVVLYSQVEEADRVIREKVREKHASLHEADFDRIRMKQKSIVEQSFDYKGYEDITISLHGDHQVRNAAVALEAIEVLKEK
ncbi:MAG TPA: Mur ligase family protein, partial [Clostridiaceae bacterium]|nr:Mur ligase family protein [Clostridiaceae bacterium]